MVAKTLTEFTAEMRTRNLSRPNQFYVDIVLPLIFTRNNKGFIRPVKSLMSMVSMFCNSASTPQTTLMTEDNHIENGVRRKYAYDQDYQNLNLGFYIDQDFAVKRFFDQWKQAIVPQRRLFNYPEQYTAPLLNVYILNQEGKATYKYTYLNIFPKSFNAIELSYAHTSAVSTFTVDFVYEDVYYTSLKKETLVDFTSKPEQIDNSITPPVKTVNIEVKQSFEDSSFRNRGINGTRWTESTNGITSVKPFQW